VYRVPWGGRGAWECSRGRWGEGGDEALRDMETVVIDETPEVARELEPGSVGAVET